MSTSQTMAAKRRTPWYGQLWTQVLIAMAIGILLGWLKPDLGG